MCIRDRRRAGELMAANVALREALIAQAEANFDVCLLYTSSATMWTCDFSHEYVTINGDYRSRNTLTKLALRAYPYAPARSTTRPCHGSSR